jgi:hypothetical protein
MASLELDEEGHLLLHGKRHVAPSPEELTKSKERMPQFYEALSQISTLVNAVDHDDWRATMAGAIVQLLNATQEEIFDTCCPRCKATIEVVFGAGAASVVS